MNHKFVAQISGSTGGTLIGESHVYGWRFELGLEYLP